MFTELLTGVITEIGKDIKPNQEILRQMLGGDRDYLVFELQKVSFGSELEMETKCPSCEENLFIETSIDDLEVHRLENGAGPDTWFVSVELDTGYTDADGTTHKEIEVWFPRGETQEALAPIARMNPGKASTSMLYRCCKRFGTLEKATEKILRDLTKKDRDKIRRALEENAPGPDPMIEIDCTECGHRFETLMDMSRFFGGN